MAMVDAGTKVLVLCGDHWHPADTIRRGLGPMDGNPFSFDWIENAHDWSEEIMMKYNLAILTKSNNISSKDETPWMTNEVESTFLRYLHAGNGLLIIHSGTAGYREQTQLRMISGGAFASHPEQCSVVVETKEGNPLDAAPSSFTIFDEHYMMDLDDEKAEVFLTTSSEHGTQPGGWIRLEGTGRVCVLTPGHNLHVWLDPAYQILIQKALYWCGKLE